MGGAIGSPSSAYTDNGVTGHKFTSVHLGDFDFENYATSLSKMISETTILMSGSEDSTDISLLSINEYFGTECFRQELETRGWSICRIARRINLSEWVEYTDTCPRDPYVPNRFKSLSFITIDSKGNVVDLGLCPIAPFGASSGEAEWFYDRLGPEMLLREDFKNLMIQWASLWGLFPNEPIMVQVLGVRGDSDEDYVVADAIYGQGIHRDGCKAVSILCISRDNVEGGINFFYSDETGTPHTPTGKDEKRGYKLEPGNMITFCDDKLFHSASLVRPMEPNKPFRRFAMIISARFTDPVQSAALKSAFPNALHYTADPLKR